MQRRARINKASSTYSLPQIESLAHYCWSMGRKGNSEAHMPASKLGVVRPAGICIKPQPRERRMRPMLPQGSEQTEEQTLQGRPARLSTGTEEVTLTINSLNSSL